VAKADRVIVPAGQVAGFGEESPAFPRTLHIMCTYAGVHTCISALAYEIIQHPRRKGAAPGKERLRCRSRLRRLRHWNSPL